MIGPVVALAVTLFLALPVLAEDSVVLTNSFQPLPAEMTSRAVMTEAENLTPVPFMISLKMRDIAGLQARIAKGEVIAPAEMLQKYYPLESDYKAVSAWLIQNGFTITNTDPNRMGIFATGTVSQIQTAMKMSFAKVTVNGTTYMSAASAPSVPLSVATPIVGINGLQPHLQKHVHSKIKAKNPLVQNQAPYYPSEILKAYGATNLSVTGAGQTIGIVIDTPPKTTDLTKFWTTTGVAQSLNNILFVQVVQGKNPPLSGEESLDVEWSSSIAPNAKVRVYVTTDLSDINLDAAYQRIITDLPTTPGLNQISLSYGGNELDTLNSQMTTDAQYFLSMASSGVTVFASSGDDGSRPDINNPPQISSPSNDPNVTAVGGTSLNLNSSGGVASETVWSGSGGGVSTFFSRPTWQKGSGISAGTFRLNPDISSAADPNTGALVVQNGSQQTVGGTSWSSPTWAGFCALINEARSKANKSTIGVLGPNIYPLIGSSSFRDITSGSNGNFSAGTGFDLCTGIGVPNVASLIAVLSGGIGPNSPTITSFSPSTGPVGTTVTINGTNFISPMTVMFNGVTAQGIFTSNQGTFQVPAGATTGDITVTTSNGTGSSDPNQFTVTAGDVTGLPNLIPVQLAGWSDRVIVCTSPDSSLDSRATPTDTLYVGFAIANIGTVGINSSVQVEVDVDASKQTVSLTNPFAANSSQFKLGINIATLPLGQHTIAVKIDPNNLVTEANENDNSFTKIITVLPPLPAVTITATGPTADANANTPGEFTVTLASVQTSDIVVNFTLGGTAVSGSDFASIGTSVTVPTGQTTAKIPVNAMLNAFAAGSGKLTVTLASGGDYLAGTPSSASVTIQNVPPALVLESQPTAAPNPAPAGKAVAFSASFSTATSDTITYTWDFKDGTTLQGPAVMHSYLAPGVYNVVVTAKDGLLTSTATVSVTVSAIPMTVTSVALRFNFRTNRDSLTINGSIPIGSGYTPEGDTVVVSIGGFQGSFPLSTKGLSRGSGMSLAIKGRMKFGIFTDAVLKYQLKLTNQNLFDAFNPNPGFSQDTSASGIVLPILFQFNSTTFIGNKSLTYKTNGKTATAK